MKKTLWLLYFCDYDCWEPVALFPSKEAALAYAVLPETKEEHSGEGNPIAMELEVFES